MKLKDKVERALDKIRPALQSDGGNVELIDVKDNKVYIKLTGACQGCPSATVTLQRGITRAIKNELPEIEEIIEVLPNGSMRGSKPDLTDPWAGRKRIDGVKLTLAVASGKGGVGKSTVAVNLALALKLKGLKIGILDADIYGPSMPTMLNVHSIEPAVEGSPIKPAEAYGLKVMSMGFLAGKDDAMIWRGPMIVKALDFFIKNVAWGELDCLVIDLPPGTGDAQLTIAQKIPLDGAIIVTTPSDVALIDARRGLRMFGKVRVPVLGIVENMSYFCCPHCNERTDIFSAGGGKTAASELDTEFLGEIPLDPLIRLKGDIGKPVVEADPESAQASYFSQLAEKSWEIVTKSIPGWDKDACHFIDEVSSSPS